MDTLPEEIEQTIYKYKHQLEFRKVLLDIGILDDNSYWLSDTKSDTKVLSWVQFYALVWCSDAEEYRWYTKGWDKPWAYYNI